MNLVIGLCGGGTVGGGVAMIVSEKFASLGINARIKLICVRNKDKPRDFTIPQGARIITDYHEVLDDEEINCVVEVMGGVTDAKELVFESIARGKHVITANKPLIAGFLPEIEKALKSHPGVHFGYEAAVCGGIPIIHTVLRAFCTDTIHRVAGIMNGTTNFMLTMMETEKKDYDYALSCAKERGYAEADPAADVEGWDARSKLCILGKLAFGVHVPESEIYCVGITKITNDDFEFARQHHSTIKILGVAQRAETSPSVTLFVSPMIVPRENSIASIGGVTNIVQISSDHLGSTTLIGPGAGRFATANSVVTDLVLLAKNQLPAPFPASASNLEVTRDFESSFYIRFSPNQENAAPEVDIESAAAAATVNLEKIHRQNSNNYIVLTKRTTLSAAERFVAQLRTEALLLPILS